MAAQLQSFVVPTDTELLQAQADLWRHSLYYLKSMALKCAVELGIPTAIYRLGGAATVPKLIPALSLPRSKLPYLRRIMRLLAASGIFTVDRSSDEPIYGISPTSYLLVEGNTADGRHLSHVPIVHICTSTRYVDSAMSLAGWFKKDVVTPPFEVLHGAKLFDHETMGSLDPEYHKASHDALAVHDNFGIDMALKEFRDLFEGIQSMTMCGDRSGTMAKALVKAFPHIKCIVLGPPQEIAAIPADGVINYVAGDMLKFIPPAQAVVLKLVLHHWSDEDCVKILTQCKKAIPSRKEGGKVVIGDIVIDSSPGPMLEAQLLMDIVFMTMTEGRQRDENDWHELFMKAGFSDYKLLKKFGARGVFEVYP